MIKRVLGFDISSSCIGYSILEFDDITKYIRFISCNYHKPIKKGSILDRLYHTKSIINKIIYDNRPDYIAIEDIVQYMKNKSSAKTVIMLAVFNRMIGVLAYDYLNKSPELFNVMQIRHGLKFDKVLPKKEEMPKLVSKHLDIEFPYVYGKKNKKIAPESNDMADSVAVALYCIYVHTGRIIPKNKKGKKNNE